MDGQTDSALPLLCANGCGFYGSHATSNMCSKCFKSSVFKGVPNQQSIIPAKQVRDDQLPKVVDSDLEATTDELKPVDGQSKVGEQEQSKGEEEAPRRCMCCKKKVGIASGFTCRCGKLFCSTHRYANMHDCTFDYKAMAQERIAKANPVIKANKIDKI